MLKEIPELTNRFRVAAHGKIVPSDDQNGRPPSGNPPVQALPQRSSYRRGTIRGGTAATYSGGRSAPQGNIPSVGQQTQGQPRPAAPLQHPNPRGGSQQTQERPQYSSRGTVRHSQPNLVRQTQPTQMSSSQPAFGPQNPVSSPSYTLTTLTAPQGPPASGGRELIQSLSMPQHPPNVQYVPGSENYNRSPPGFYIPPADTQFNLQMPGFLNPEEFPPLVTNGAQGGFMQT